MGKCHVGDGQAKVRLLLETFAHPLGAAEDKAGGAFSRELHLAQRPGQLLGGTLLSLRRKDAQPRSLGNLGADGLGLLLAAAALRQLDDAATTVAAQPFFVFPTGGLIKRLLEFSNA